MKLLIINLLVVFGFSSAWAGGRLPLYRTCVGTKNLQLKLFASPVGGASRPSILMFGDSAITGSSNYELTQFVSDDGDLKASFNMNRNGSAGTAKVTFAQRTYEFAKCYENDEAGGGSVSVHN